jgi:hypothetical protein
LRAGIEAASGGKLWAHGENVKEILRTNDPVVLSVAEAVLADEDIPFFVADRHMSVLEGSVGFLARRVLVLDEDVADARAALVEAGLGAELADG